MITKKFREDKQRLEEGRKMIIQQQDERKTLMYDYEPHNF